MAVPSLPSRLLASPGRPDLRDADAARLTGEHPGLADWYELLTAHARASGAHLMLSKKFLFKPQQRRDAAGLGDQHLVSNRSGTTGMNETFLERLTRARQNHPLAPLRAVVGHEMAEMGTNIGVRSQSRAAAPISVALVG
jgi:hypothetical protein